MACYNHLQSLPNGSSGLHVDDTHIYMYGVLCCVWVQLLSIRHRQGHVLATGAAINYTDWLVPSSLHIIVAKITEMTKMMLLLTHSFVVLCLLQCDWSAV